MPTHHVEHSPAPPDVELDRARPDPVRYDLAWPDSEHASPAPPGLVLLIPGFGQDNDDGYLRAFREWIAARFGLAAMTVRYHGIHNRPNQGAAPQFTTEDAGRLYHACEAHGIAWPPPDQAPNLNQLIQQLHHATSTKAVEAQRRGAPAPSMTTLTCGLLSPDGPVNLGLPQALDHLAALCHLQQHRPIDTANVVALGSSHGGYLAQLCAKLAPNTFRAVLDNSGYAQLPERYVDGRPSLTPDCFDAWSPVFRFAYFVTSGWSLDAAAPNHYHADARALRDLAFAPHREAVRAATDRPAAVRCVHAPDDEIAPTTDKQRYVETLRRDGVDATIQVMAEPDVDGRYVKTLDHGLGLSLRTFFEKHYTTLPAHETAHTNDAARGTTLIFAGSDRAYHLTHGPDGPAVRYTSNQ
ncbi:MAG: DUF2920 family protein [Planctomycetota bacterium]